MKRINATRNTVLAESILIADTPIKRIIGLIGRKEFNPGQALVIRPCKAIHTFFMRFAIDVIFIDRDKRVVKALPHFRPYRLSRMYFRAYAVIELPVGTIESSLTHEGDTLLLQI